MFWKMAISFSLGALAVSASTNLANNATQNQYHFTAKDFLKKNVENPWDWVKSTSKIKDQNNAAMSQDFKSKKEEALEDFEKGKDVALEKKDQQDLSHDEKENYIKQIVWAHGKMTNKDLFNNQKMYARGTDKFEHKGLISYVWVTKDYIGRVAATLGVGGSLGVLLAIGSIVVKYFMIKYTGTAIISSLPAEAASISLGSLAAPVLAALIAIIGLLYVAATIVFMFKITDKNTVGVYFVVEWSVVFSAITLMATIRKQNENESASRLIPLNEAWKFGNKKESFDLLSHTKQNAKIQQVWREGSNGSNPFRGVFDVSRYTRYNTNFRIKTASFKIAFRDTAKKSVDVKNNHEWNQFIKDYLHQEQVDYLFFYLEKQADKNQYLFRVGGTKFDNDVPIKESWMTTNLNLSGNITDGFLQIFIN